MLDIIRKGQQRYGLWLRVLLQLAIISITKTYMQPPHPKKVSINTLAAVSKIDKYGLRVKKRGEIKACRTLWTQKLLHVIIIIVIIQRLIQHINATLLHESFADVNRSDD